MRSVRFVVAAALLAVCVGAAVAQSATSTYPNRPIRYIVPFPPGGSTDIVARIVANALTEDLGRQVVIDNRSGAAGTLGAELAAHATPDGYTLFACNIASLAVSPALYKKLNYDPAGSFAPVGLVGSNPNVLVVHPSLGVGTVGEFIAYVKARPGKLNYGSAGVGTSPQLSMEMFRMNAGLELVHVPYKGGGPLVLAVTANEVQAAFGTVPSWLGPGRAHKVRMLGVTSSMRSPDLPDVPTIAESGMPGFEVISWQGLCTPAGVPQPVLARLRRGLENALALPETKKQLADQGIQSKPLVGEPYAAFIRSERAKWKKVVKDVGIPPQ